MHHQLIRRCCRFFNPPVTSGSGQQKLRFLRQFASPSSSVSSSSGDGGGGGGGFDTSFGFERVERAEKQGRVNAVFNSVSDSYDLMNDLMSLGLHRCWKRRFVESANPRPGWRAVDVAGGTGDIAIGLVRWSSRQATRGVNSSATHSSKNSSNSSSSSNNVDEFRRQAERLEDQQQQSLRSSTSVCHVTVVDPSSAMMEVGRRKVAEQLPPRGFGADSVAWIEGRAESLPLEDSSYHLYTIAFGIRNCTDLPGVLKEARRVLRPYGRFACLEFCSVDNPLLSLIYDEYSFRVIPPLGHLVAGDWDSYEYLVESIRRFPHQNAFAGMMREAGFASVGYEVLLPGVCAIHSGYKLP